MPTKTTMTPLGGDYDDIVVKRTYQTDRDETIIPPEPLVVRPEPPPAWLPKSFSGLGETSSSSTSLLDQVKETADTIASIKPLLEFVGNYPMIAFSLVMLAIVAGGAAGGYIGAGYKTKTDRKKNPLGLPDRDDEDDDDDNTRHTLRKIKSLEKKIARLLADRSRDEEEKAGAGDDE